MTYLASAVTEIKNNPSRHLGNRSWFGAKGQLVSEHLFHVINFAKKQRKNLTNFCSRI